MGMSLTTAITVFIRQAVRQKKIPFEISLSDSESRVIGIREAMAVSEAIWQRSLQNVTDKMTHEEIDVEITMARSERRAQRLDV